MRVPPEATKSETETLTPVRSSERPSTNTWNDAYWLRDAFSVSALVPLPDRKLYGRTLVAVGWSVTGLVPVGPATVTATLRVSVASTVLRISIVTACGVCGAVYKPVGEMVPTVALPPTTEFTDHVTTGPGATGGGNI